MSNSEGHPHELGQSKGDIEHQKLELERERLNVERDKARWSAVAIAVPVLAAIATAWFGLASQNKQAQSQFQIKAAEIVLQTRSPTEASDKAKALKALFPDWLPDKFAESFQAAQFPSYAPDIITEKVELLKMLHGKSSKEKREILELWVALFGDDDAGPKILKELESGATPGSARMPSSAK